MSAPPDDQAWMAARHQKILGPGLGRRGICGWVEVDDGRASHDAPHVRHDGCLRRGDFDRLAEIYAEDASWINADPKGPHCRNRDDIFTMFRQRMASGIRVGFDELRSTPTEVVLTARAADFGHVVSVFSFQGRRIASVKDYPSMEAAEAALTGPRRPPGAGGGAGGG
jgi:ketosteroid isomerase-like protein